MAISRRKILRAAGVAAAFTIVPRRVLGGAGHVPPSETVNIALIGAGGQGRTNLRKLFKEEDARVIAIADPAERWDLNGFYYKDFAGRGPLSAEIDKQYGGEKNPKFKCALFEDFREMLDKEKGIDAVLIATPDHLHAY